MSLTSYAFTHRQICTMEEDEQEVLLRQATKNLPFPARLIDWDWSDKTYRMYAIVYFKDRCEFATYLVCPHNNFAKVIYENGVYGLHSLVEAATDLDRRVS